MGLSALWTCVKGLAEIEISVLGGQCLKRRIGSKEILERETTAYVSDPNARQAKVLWGFSVNEKPTANPQIFYWRISHPQQKNDQ